MDWSDSLQAFKWSPYLVDQLYLSRQEPAGAPKFLCVSLRTCHALATPAGPPEPHHSAAPLCWLPMAPDCRHLLCPVSRLNWLQEARSSLWPIRFPVYASYKLFGNHWRTMKSLLWYQPSVAPLLHPFITSFLHATLGTSGWLNLSRQGLSPCKRRQASLGARSPWGRKGTNLMLPGMLYRCRGAYQSC